MTQIPLIDLDRWWDGDNDERALLAGEVDDHLRRLGFLLVSNHRIAPSVMDECREQTLRFFHLPPEKKAEMAMQPGTGYRGWVGPGLESNAATYGVATLPDLKETFGYGPVDVIEEKARQSDPMVFAPNRWPSEPAGFQSAAEAWWRAGRRLSDELLALFSLALGLPADALPAQCGATTAQVSLNWYGPRSGFDTQPNQFRIGPHTDFGTVTVLDRQPGIGGLQVKDEAGVWIDAPYVEGTLVINTGDLIRRWTNDRWCSNQHRVLPPPAEVPTEELLSLVFFHEPDPDALIEALPTCVDETHPPLHEPVTAYDYLAEKMAALEVT